jgi:muramoyltetrapeptide carboxypeptidase LdcA involved in peptidoglycan recycling
MALRRREFLKLIGCTLIASQFPTLVVETAALVASVIVYPAPLRPGDTIGVTSPSAGVGPALKPRLQFSIQALTKLGYRVREGKYLVSDVMVSAPARDRADELQVMLLDDSVNAILPPWGGELLIDILPLLDWDTLTGARPKWIIGYSDLSTLMLAYTLRTHVATLNGSNLLETPIYPTDPALAHWHEVATLSPGASFVQRPASMYQASDVDWEKNPYVTRFDVTERVVWKCLMREGDPDYGFNASGRLLGGTLDVIAMLVGTEFGDVNAFAESCAPEGLLIYLDNADMNTAQYCRMLHHLKLAGWFKHANAILIGRTAIPL